MQDTLLTELLDSLGLEGSAIDTGLAVLYRAGLTRPGKQRIAKAKVLQAQEAILDAIVRTCHKQACREEAQRDSRMVVNVRVKHCENCGGKDNRTAIAAMLEAMRTTGRTKLLVVGGSPNSRHELRALCMEPCELRFLTEEQNPMSSTCSQRGVAALARAVTRHLRA